jgi:hypothetical protein
LGQGGTPGFMKRKARLRTVLGQSEIPNGSGLFLNFPQNRLRQFRRRRDHRGQNSRRFAFTKSAAIDKALFAGLIN